MKNIKIKAGFMKLAINQARKNIKKLDGGPFGACIVKNGKVLAVARNTVLKNDATCHAEINAIRKASRRLKSFDLSGSVIYSTTEPCPMCYSAIHWAKIDGIFFGTRIQDAKNFGFNELTITNRQLGKLGRSKIRLTADVMRNDCLKLLRDWDIIPEKTLY